MTNTLLAIFPDVFAGGAALPGYPAGAWPAGDTSCQLCGGSGPSSSDTGQKYADAAKKTFSWSGTRPCSQQWVGGGDEYHFAQWLPVVASEFQILANLGSGSTGTGAPSGWTRTEYKDGSGNVRLQTNLGPSSQKHDLTSLGLNGQVVSFLGLDKTTGACGLSSTGSGGAGGGPGGAGGGGGAGGAGGNPDGGSDAARDGRGDATRDGSTGGAPGTGGTSAGVGATGTGGASGTGGSSTTGGNAGSGGSAGSGGTSAAGGTATGGSANGGTTSTGGGSGGAAAFGGNGSGGNAGSGGSSASGGNAGSGGSSPGGGTATTNHGGNGCACILGAHKSNAGFAVLSAVLLGLATCRRRRRRR